MTYTTDMSKFIEMRERNDIARYIGFIKTYFRYLGYEDHELSELDYYAKSSNMVSSSNLKTMLSEIMDIYRNIKKYNTKEKVKDLMVHLISRAKELKDKYRKSSKSKKRVKRCRCK